VSSPTFPVPSRSRVIATARSRGQGGAPDWKNGLDAGEDRRRLFQREDPEEETELVSPTPIRVSVRKVRMTLTKGGGPSCAWGGLVLPPRGLATSGTCRRTRRRGIPGQSPLLGGNLTVGMKHRDPRLPIVVFVTAITIAGLGRGCHAGGRAIDPGADRRPTDAGLADSVPKVMTPHVIGGGLAPASSTR
jgi:hypothetical protein